MWSELMQEEKQTRIRNAVLGSIFVTHIVYVKLVPLQMLKNFVVLVPCP